MATAAFLATVRDPMTEPERVALNAMSSDLQFLLGESDVPERLRLRLTTLGYRTVAAFSVMGDDRNGMRATLSADVLDPAEVGLTPALAAEARLYVNYMLSAWIIATTRLTEEIHLAAQTRMLRLPAVMPRASLVALRQRYEREHGRVTDHIFPCAAMIEKRLEEIEDGSLAAQPLSEVISIELSSDETTTLQELGPNVKVRRTPKAIALPDTTEELRNRYKTLAISYILASYKHSTRQWLRTATMEVWLAFTEYILSDEIALYNLDTEGVNIKASWSTVLSYELQIRKLAVRKILHEDLDFAAALLAARSDLGCKERYFISPTALITAGQKRSVQQITGGDGGKGAVGKSKKQKRREAHLAQGGDSGKGKKGAAKGGAKGKGKGKGKGKRQTPDGRMICGFYNSQNGCRSSTCQFLHLCGHCFAEDHTAQTCTAV